MSVKIDKNEGAADIELRFYDASDQLIDAVSGPCSITLYASEITDLRTADKSLEVATWKGDIAPGDCHNGVCHVRGRFNPQLYDGQLVSSWGVVHATAGGVSSNWKSGFFWK